MNIIEARNTMQKMFLSSFSIDTALIALDNQSFGPPDGTDAWARLTILPNDGGQDSIGAKSNRKYVKIGLLNAQIFTLKDTATNANDVLVQEALDIYEGETEDGLWFTEGRIQITPTEDKWYRQDAVIEFNYQETK